MLSILTLIGGLVLSVFEQQVLIPSNAQQPSLHGIVATPTAEIPARKPAVLIMIGSGEGSTDDDARTFNPFQSLARKMSEAGFVTLRFDKRGTGYNKDAGEFRLQSLRDYCRDAKDAYAYLKSRKDVDPERIYLAGHSIGTLVAAQLASELNIKGLILIAGPDEKMLPVMEEQQRFYFVNTHSAQVVDRLLNFQLRPLRELQQGTFDPKKCDAYFCQTEGDLQIISGQAIAYWKDVLAADQKENLRKIPLTTPVLCIAGKNDWVIDSKHSQEACRFAGEIGLPATFVEIPQSDHFFSTAATKEQSLKYLIDRDYSKIEENTAFLDAIVKWLVELGP